MFGEIAEGFDTLEKINETICDEDDRPYQDIRYVVFEHKCLLGLPQNEL